MLVSQQLRIGPSPDAHSDDGSRVGQSRMQSSVRSLAVTQDSVARLNSVAKLFAG